MVVFGFTYLDTLKICLRKEWNAQGVHFLGRGDEKDLKALKEIVRGERIMGLFTGAFLRGDDDGIGDASMRVGSVHEKCTASSHINTSTTNPHDRTAAEFPSNPLLQNPDLGQLSALGREHGFPMVVDDTISNFHNVDLLRVRFLTWWWFCISGCICKGGGQGWVDKCGCDRYDDRK